MHYLDKDDYLASEERLDIYEISPRNGVLQGLDAVIQVTGLLAKLPLQADHIVRHRFDGLQVHPVGQHQLLVDGAVGV